MVWILICANSQDLLRIPQNSSSNLRIHMILCCHEPYENSNKTINLKFYLENANALSRLVDECETLPVPQVFPGSEGQLVVRLPYSCQNQTELIETLNRLRLADRVNTEPQFQKFYPYEFRIPKEKVRSFQQKCGFCPKLEFYNSLFT